MDQAKQRTLERRVLETGQLPKTLELMPDLDDGLTDYWHGYGFLHASRTSGGVIPLAEIAAYLQIAGIDDPEQRLVWLRLMRAMDAEYLDWYRASVPAAFPERRRR